MVRKISKLSVSRTVCGNYIYAFSILEAQEHYVLAIDPAGLDVFKRFADQERCSYLVRT